MIMRRLRLLRHAPPILRCCWLLLTGQRRKAFWCEVRAALRHLRSQTHPAACAWCGRGTRYGNPKLPTSHGICTSCRKSHFRFVPLRRLLHSHN